MPIEIVCQTCNKVFYTYPSTMKAGEVKYCSSACYHKAQNLRHKNLETRFWEKVDKSGNCWVWTGGTTQYGYGHTKDDNGRDIMTHQVSWQLHYGPIPPGMCVCHTCDNPPCVRPDHLFLGTKRENLEDMVRKGRQHHNTHMRGEGNGRHKLMTEQVKSIRNEYNPKLPLSILARKYDVSDGAIWFIVHNITWKNID
jgi:hypothetical protein